MKKILILQMRPEDITCESEFKAILKVGHLSTEEVDRLRVEQCESFDVDLNNYSAVIAGGSPFDVSTPEEKKGTSQRNVESFFNELFDRIIPSDLPFLGVCSGNGLLGKYTGTPITGKYAERIGKVYIFLTDAGEKDPLLKGLPKEFLALAGHKEACDEVPPGAVLLASSDTCPVQMFRMKQNIYSLQFHPEADDEEFVLRINTYKNYGYFKPEKAKELIEAVREVQTPVPREILRRFVQRYHP